MLEESQTSLPWHGEADQYVGLKTAKSFCSWLLANTVETETKWDYVAGEEVVTSPVSQKSKVRVVLGTRSSPMSIILIGTQG